MYCRYYVKTTMNNESEGKKIGDDVRRRPNFEFEIMTSVDRTHKQHIEHGSARGEKV
jgi:hypothetical protein